MKEFFRFIIYFKFKQNMDFLLLNLSIYVGKLAGNKVIREVRKCDYA